jgi:hypothetical protein
VSDTTASVLICLRCDHRYAKHLQPTHCERCNNPLRALACCEDHRGGGVCPQHPNGAPV